MRNRLRFFRRTAALALLPAFAVSTNADAQTSSGISITGTISDVATGLPVAKAAVTLYRGNSVAGSTTTDSRGNYIVANQTPAVYHLVVRDSGYDGAQSEDVPIVPGQTLVSINLSLTQAVVQSQLRTIGGTTTSARSALQRTSTISRDLSPQTLLNQNYANVAEGLNQLPGVNFAGHGSSVGDDTSISLRGFDPSESQTLLDGHPIGPIGVGGGGFNYQVSPYFVLRNTQVTFGAGALGLYGTDATGGAIDMQTIDPTKESAIDLTQGFASQGKALSAFKATGSVGRFGYAVAAGTQGTYGNFKPGYITQTGNLGSDVSPGNIAANTYYVGGNYDLRNALTKFQYTIAPGTVATVTGYTATARQDKTGVGDNDYQPYDQQFLVQQAQAGTGACAGTPLVPVTIDNAGTVQCQTVAQATQATYGPAGGGGGAFQTIVNQDYHGRLTSNVLGQTLTLDGYIDTYNSNYSRNQSSQNDAGIFTGGFRQSLFKTNGFLVSDDIAHGNNDFGFGYFAQHQTVDGSDFDRQNLVIVPRTTLFLGTNNVFFRDTFSPTPAITLYTNVYYKLLSTTGSDTVDPRATLLLRPTANDVVRLVAGKTDGEPAAQLAQTALNQTPTNLNPGGHCAELTGVPGNGLAGFSKNPIAVGTLAANNLQQETASDFEVTYGHSFHNGSSVQIGAYDQRATNLVSSLSVPVQAGIIPDALLQQIYARIRSGCGSGYVGTLNDLSLSQATNSRLSGLFRGIEVSGRAYATPNVFLDFSYDLQHAQTFGYTDTELTNDATLINGGQSVGIPLNKGSIAAEFDNRHGFDARLEGYLFGINNAYARPAYGFANATFSYGAPGTGTTLNLGINNFTNSAVERYGLINDGVPLPANSFNPGVVNYTERFGLLPRTFIVTLTQHVR